MEVQKRVQLVSLCLVRESSFLFKHRSCVSPETAYQLFSQFIQDKATEHLMIACLNVKNEVVNVSTVSIGSVNQTIANIGEVIKVALLSNAVGIAVAHNHPSGHITPSIKDSAFTEKLKSACELMEIDLIDHLIIGSEGDYYSFREEGELVGGMRG